MSSSLDQVLADISALKRRIQEALPSWDSPSSDVERFSDRAKMSARGKVLTRIPKMTRGGKLSKKVSHLVPFGGEKHKAGESEKRAELLRKLVTKAIPRRVSSIPHQYRGAMTVSSKQTLSSRVLDLLKKKGIDAKSASESNIRKVLKTARGSQAKPDQEPKVKGTPEHLRRIERKSFAVQSKKGRARAGHGAGEAGKGGAAQRPYGKAFGTPSAPYDPEDQEEQVGNYVARTISAGGLSEAVLLERRSKAELKRRKESQARQRASYLASPERAAHEKSQRKAGKESRKDRKTRRQRFKDKRAAGSLKGHKEKHEDGKSKYENPTTFKKCSPGAMVSTPYLRHEIPQNRFVDPDDDHPTYPIRSNCRASLGGVARMLQYNKPGKAKARQVLARINRLGGTRGKVRFRAWGTGVGGQRMKTHRGASGVAKRHKAYGTSTGERDDRLHTAKEEHGKAGNREVPRATGHSAKQAIGPKSKRKKKREAAGRKVTIKRGQKKIGKEAGPVKVSPRRELRHAGAAQLAKWARKKR